MSPLLTPKERARDGLVHASRDGALLCGKRPRKGERTETFTPAIVDCPACVAALS